MLPLQGVAEKLIKDFVLNTTNSGAIENEYALCNIRSGNFLPFAMSLGNSVTFILFENFNLSPKSWPYQATVCFNCHFFFSEINSKDSRDSTTVSGIHRDRPLRYWVTRVECILSFRYCVISSPKSRRHLCQSRVCPFNVWSHGVITWKWPLFIYQKPPSDMPIAFWQMMFERLL